MKHINIYGPAASGKTRYAEEFRAAYGCKEIIDEGRGPVRPHTRKALILTQQKVNAANVENVSVEDALRKIGVEVDV